MQGNPKVIAHLNEALKEDGTLTRPFAYGSTTVMKVRWNDGNVITEVDVPMVSTGQRVVIEHAQSTVSPGRKMRLHVATQYGVDSPWALGKSRPVGLV